MGKENKKKKPNFDFLKNRSYSTKKLKNWLREDKSICQWEGITCGDITPGVGKGSKHQYDKAKRFLTMHANGRVDDLNPSCWCISKEEVDEWEWGDDNDNADESNNENNFCNCLDGSVPKYHAPMDAVTKIDLMDYGHLGTLPEELFHLKFLHRLNLFGNNFFGPVPSKFGLFENLHYLDLGFNELTGTIPASLGGLNRTLDELWLEKNFLSGSIPEELMSLNLELLALNNNDISSSIPASVGNFTNITHIFLGSNSLSGIIPTQIGLLPKLVTLDFENCKFTGIIPTEIGLCRKLEVLNLNTNLLHGSFPLTVFELSHLKTLSLGDNNLTGSLPYSSMNIEAMWPKMKNLLTIDLHGNQFIGSIPTNMFTRSLRSIDISKNNITGNIPSEVQLSEKLVEFHLQSNMIEGLLPATFLKLRNLSNLNIMGNRLHGTIPEELCKHKASQTTYPLTFPCTDYIACPAGTFHPEGHASDLDGCAKCPPCAEGLENQENKAVCEYLGQSHCFGNKYAFVSGNMDRGKTLTQREILRLIYIKTNGNRWGDTYAKWSNIDIDKCELPGVNCKNGLVTKLDLRNAELCTQGSESMCMGIPTEIGLLGDSLEILDLTKSFRWTNSFGIPTEIGMLTNLRYLHISGNRLTGKIPSEIGRCTDLRVLNVSQCNISGPLPTTLGKLTKLEKINMVENSFRGTLPTEIGLMTNLKEILMSKSALEGSLPEELGMLGKLDNLELYGNALVGSLPKSVAELTRLRRIDLFNNKLSGTLDELMRISALQIVHLRSNHFNGTIPNHIGSITGLSWIDASGNKLAGTIPASISSLLDLRDFRMGDNYLEGPVPSDLCHSTQVNGGSKHEHSCDFILCPIDTYSQSGYAYSEQKAFSSEEILVPCHRCPQKETSLYLGSKFCRELNQNDFVSMFYEAMDGDTWPPELRKMWNTPGTSVCDWAGVRCDTNGQVTGFDFPLSVFPFESEIF